VFYEFIDYFNFFSFIFCYSLKSVNYLLCDFIIIPFDEVFFPKNKNERKNRIKAGKKPHFVFLGKHDYRMLDVYII
jgi:hypothetical protein